MLESMMTLDTNSASSPPTLTNGRGRQDIPPRTVHSSADPAAMFVAFRSGENGAFEAILDHFEGMMRSVARRYVRSRDDVEDAVQDAWLSFARSATTIKTPEAIGGWLKATVSHAAIAIARRSDRDTLVPSHDDRGADSGRDLLELEDERRTVQSALQRLPKGESQLLWMLFGAELSYAEITARTGRPTGAIGPTRQRAMDKMRRDPGLRRLASQQSL